VTTRDRPAWPIAEARPACSSSEFSAFASAAGSSGGTSIPVSPSATTSGIPPTRDAATAVPQAIASRFTIPSGSYTDGQANTVACVSSWTISGRGSMSGIQITPSRSLRSPATSDDTSASSWGVSAAPAHSTSCANGSSAAAARSSTGSPFCRVMRPTNNTYGLSGCTPCFDSAATPGSGAYSEVSMPLRITVIRSGAISGYAERTSAAIPSDTAITASAEVSASRSAQHDRRYPPPSCSAFHGRSGSREWVVTTCGIPYRSDARYPARFAYQVWECTTSASPTASAMDKSAENTRNTESCSTSHAWCATALSRGAPWQWTVRSTSGARNRDRYSTWTPAPPYTSGGYSRVSSATFTPRPPPKL
jgi:hypothetical protein